MWSLIGSWKISEVLLYEKCVEAFFQDRWRGRKLVAEQKKEGLKADVEKNVDVTETWKDNPHSSLQAVCIYFLIIIINVLLKKKVSSII